ncbi:adenylate/guanylate cyclase domain-containing protein [Jiella sonneratiae]|uniref:Adenylate/guanylate cyclase domain-containing protein n=1 Tax=Jiella sonneratiae TaxID=2816856 RepID=A0ABS3IZQ0_9HYPH|nr:adenylate/guanylate cyclase domain-containing protein [Jiella sonneratiae]MBO0902365.1 adenylate/guanylate cyclase domain-containing protein [Jiella sonneratiae]
MDRTKRRRIVETAFCAAAAILLCLGLSLWQPFRMAEARVFDLFATLSPPVAATADDGDGDGGIVVVAIDEPSFAEIGLQWPWPRDLHARLVDALRQAGVRAIGLDLVFAEPSSEAADAALAQALGPDVVLAADESVIETPQMSQLIRTEPLPEFVAAGARVGLASVSLDPDNVLRRVPAAPDGFAAKLLEAAGEAPVAAAGGLLRPMGPARSYPTVSYYQALDPGTFLPPGFLKGKIAVVGRSLQMAIPAETGGADSFATPFTSATGMLVPGVEIQATIADNLRHALTLRPAGLPLVAGFVVVAAFAAAFVAFRPADLWSVLAGLCLVAAVFGASAAAFFGLRLFLPPLAPSLAVAAVLAPLAARDITQERAMRRGVIRAFGHYLAPALVERLARDPSALKLGGERRELTILFSDIRNFTTLAESMKDEPERLTQLINRLLTPLSQAVLDRGGTIDKFIGDCIMAFWNAPLDDPDHARHAVEAGLAMLAAVEGLNAELGAELGAAAPKLAVGVGINTGTCVVGNMGSATRFDYSVLGDAVNYASRLESASKECAVPLLVGAATAAAISPGLAPLLVARIAVKGRSGVAPVYTVLSVEPLGDEARKRFDVAVEALLAGEGGGDAACFADRPALAGLHATIAAREARRNAKPLKEAPHRMEAS